MIWKRLKKSTPKQEEEFQERLEENEVGPKEKLIMVLTAYATILLPCLLILIALCALVMWIFGML